MRMNYDLTSDLDLSVFRWNSITDKMHCFQLAVDAVYSAISLKKLLYPPSSSSLKKEQLYLNMSLLLLHDFSLFKDRFTTMKV